MIYHLDKKKPLIHPTCFVAPSADLIGQVELGANSSVWHQAVLRGDNDLIRIGEGSNVQDGVVIHVDPDKPCQVGANCVIGHRAVLHGCTLGDQVLVGIGATVLNGAYLPDRCLVGAGALVPEGKRLESGFLYVGIPARKVRALTEEQMESIAENARGYQRRAKLYLETAYEASS